MTEEKKNVLKGCLNLFALAMSVAVGVWVFTSITGGGGADVDHTEELTIPDEGELAYSVELTGDDLTIEGTVVNEGDHEWDGVIIEGVCYDPDGHVAGTEWTYAAPVPLAPDGEAVFRLWVPYEGHTFPDYEVYVKEADLVE